MNTSRQSIGLRHAFIHLHLVLSRVSCPENLRVGNETLISEKQRRQERSWLSDFWHYCTKLGKKCDNTTQDIESEERKSLEHFHWIITEKVKRMQARPVIHSKYPQHRLSFPAHPFAVTRAEQHSSSSHMEAIISVRTALPRRKQMNLVHSVINGYSHADM